MKRKKKVVISKNERRNKPRENKDQEGELAIAIKDSRRISSGFTLYFLFPCFYLVMMNCLMTKTILLFVLSRIMK